MCSASLRVDVTREFVLAVTSEEQHIQHIEVTLTEQGSGTSRDYPKGRDSTIKSIGPVQILQAQLICGWKKALPLARYPEKRSQSTWSVAW